MNDGPRETEAARFAKREDGQKRQCFFVREGRLKFLECALKRLQYWDGGGSFVRQAAKRNELDDCGSHEVCGDA